MMRHQAAPRARATAAVFAAAVLAHPGGRLAQEAVLEFSVTRHIMIRHAPPPEHEGFRPA